MKTKHIFELWRIWVEDVLKLFPPLRYLRSCPGRYLLRMIITKGQRLTGEVVGPLFSLMFYKHVFSLSLFFFKAEYYFIVFL